MASPVDKSPVPARKGPPPFVPYVIWFFLPLFYSVTVGPLIASNAYPNDYTSRLKVLVTSFDNSTIGAQFSALFAAASAPGLPGYEVVVASSTSPAALKAAVVDADEYWGAVWMNAGTEAALTQALQNPGSTSYSPDSAITFCWNEGRSQNSGRVAGPTRNILHGFGLVAATALTNGLSNSSASLAAVAAAQPILLTQPIGYSEEIIAPSAQLPYFFVGATLGQIIIAVLSLAVTNVVLGALAPFYMKFSPAKVTLIRFALVFIYTAGVAAAFATIMVGLGVNMGAIATSGSGVMWARLWSIQWLQMGIFVVYLGFWAMAFGPAALPLFLLPMILWNALGGWNTDLAPLGYRFFWYAPMFHTSLLMRASVFGVHIKVGEQLATLFTWLVIFSVAFAAISFVRVSGAKRVAAAAAAAAAASGKPAPALAAAPAPVPAAGETSPVAGAAANPLGETSPAVSAVPAVPVAAAAAAVPTLVGVTIEMGPAPVTAAAAAL